MKKPISPYFVLTVVLAAIISIILFTAKTDDSCDTVETILTSINVNSSGSRAHIGFDLNKQNLTFGMLSPGATSVRVVTVGYSKNATMYVWAEGNFSSWIIISPKTLEIEPGQKKDIKFTSQVPILVKDGEYNGKIVFCYQDK